MDKEYEILLDKVLRSDLIFSSTNEQIINLKKLLLENCDEESQKSIIVNNEIIEKELKLEELIDKKAISNWTLNNIYENFKLEVERIKLLSKEEPSIFNFKRLEERALNLYIKISENDLIRDKYITQLDEEIKNKVVYDEIKVFKTNNVYIVTAQIDNETNIKRYIKEEKIKKLEKK